MGAPSQNVCYIRRPRQRRSSGYRQASTASPPSQTITPQASTEPVTPAAHAAFLESLVRAHIDAINTRALDAHPSTAHFSPDFVSIPDYRHPTVGLTAHFNEIRRTQAANPHYHIDLQSAQAHVNLRAGYAEVYVKQTVTGHPAGVVRHCLSVMEFRWKQERWVCVKGTGMRGPNDYPTAEGIGGS